MDIDARNLSDDQKSQLDNLVLKTIREFSVDTVYFKDRSSRFLWNSKGHADQIGALDPAEMIGKSDYDYFPEDLAHQAMEIEKKIMETGIPHVDDSEVWHREDGTTAYLMSSKYPLYGDDGSIIGTWGVSRDITELKSMEIKLEQAYQKIQRYSRVDDLTGLYNRRYYTEYLEKIVSIIDKRGEGKFALIAIDVDDMTFINNTYDLASGDNLLRLVASIILINIDKTSTCFRIGDDEFIVLIPDSDIDNALNVAKNIQKRVSSEPISVGVKDSGNITASMGIAMFNHGMSITNLMSDVDRKLFKAKRAGKNQIVY